MGIEGKNECSQTGGDSNQQNHEPTNKLDQTK